MPMKNEFTLKESKRVFVNKNIIHNTFDSSDDDILSPTLNAIDRLDPKLEYAKSSHRSKNKSFDLRSEKSQTEYKREWFPQRPNTTLNAKRYSGYQTIASKR